MTDDPIDAKTTPDVEDLPPAPDDSRIPEPCSAEPLDELDPEAEAPGGTEP